MLVLSKGYEWGWKSNTTLICIMGSLIGFGAFMLRIKSITHPVLNIHLLKNYKFFGLILIPVVASFTFVTLLTYFPTYLTGSMQLSASTSGLIMLLLTAPVLVCPLLAGKLSSKGISTHFLIYFSVFSMILGAIILITAITFQTPLFGIAIALILIGIGMGLSAGLVDGQALSCVAESEVGMAAGLLNTFRLGSEAIAVAMYGSLFSSAVSKIAPLTLNGEHLQDTETWVNAIASGNLSLANNHISLQHTLIEIYNQAFITTNMLLTLIGTIITILAILYLKRNCRNINSL